MRAYDIIFKKRNGGILSRDEISFMVQGYSAGKIPDYQMSAFLMAVFIRNMVPQEIADLTAEMVKSGDSIDLKEIKGIKVDKHSTGGVGDGVSLMLTPVVAACGGIVPMMSGRGLGHTGGTLDKLESIQGFNVNIDEKKFRAILEKTGAAIIGQTENVAPADKKMYALRDVTATVDSIPLIAASIMSKKLAEGMDALLLDVKTGAGAFMQTMEDSVLLAEAMLSIGRLNGKTMQALITDMNQPLGYAVGNALEVAQTVHILRGDSFERRPSDFISLVVEEAKVMLLLSGNAENAEAAEESVRKAISSGSALEKFRKMIEAQGGESKVCDSPEKYLPQAPHKKDIIYTGKPGYINSVRTIEVGISALIMGAGRETKEALIDYSAGIILEKKIGDKINKGDIFGVFHYSDSRRLAEAERKFIDAYSVSEKPPEDNLKLIYRKI